VSFSWGVNGPSEMIYFEMKRAAERNKCESHFNDRSRLDEKLTTCTFEQVRGSASWVVWLWAVKRRFSPEKVVLPNANSRRVFHTMKSILYSSISRIHQSVLFPFAYSPDDSHLVPSRN